MSSITSSLLNTSEFPTDYARKSYAAALMRLMPNGTAPIFGITANMKTKTAVQFEHGYWTKTMVFPSFQINNGAGYLSTDTTVTIDSTTNVIPGMVMQNFRTKEQVLVLTVVSASSITIRRGVGTTAAAALLDDDFFPMVGNAKEEGSARPTESAVLPARVLNLCQIFRNAWGLTDSMRATLTIVGDGNVAESRMDCMAFHAADMEKALIFGEQYSGTLNGRPLRKMDGIINSIVTNASGNITTAGGTTTYDQLETALDPVFQYQTDPKIANERALFVGATAFKVINKIGRLSGTYQILEGQTSFGMQFSTFKISRGTFKMIEHPMLNTNTSWAKMALAIDFSSLSIAYLGDRKTKSEEYGANGQVNNNAAGADSVGGSLTTEMTLEMMNPAANGVIYNLTAGA